VDRTGAVLRTAAGTGGAEIPVARKRIGAQSDLIHRRVSVAWRVAATAAATVDLAVLIIVAMHAAGMVAWRMALGARAWV
jgi:hypothetical protein